MTWELTLENIAGIRTAQATVEPGVNAVRASNWQGKSSFLQGIKTVLGTETPLTEGEDAGRAVLSDDGDQYTVELVRSNGTVTRRGTPYLADEYDRICAELFAFLDEDNQIRRAVRNGENLEALLTRPLDFENIDEQIADLRAERDQVERELERAESAADRLSQLQQRVTTLESELEQLRTQRRELDADESGEADSKREELSDLRAERDRIGTRIERLESTVESVRERLSEKETERENLSVPSDEDIESTVEEVRGELREVEQNRELLQSVFESNKRILDEGKAELLTDVSHDLLSDTLSCWLCEQETTREQMESRLDTLDQRIAEYRAQAETYRERVEELEEKRTEIKTARRRKVDLTDRIGELESRLAEKQTELESARDRREELETRIEELAAAVDTRDDRVTELESEIKYAEAELSDARDELETAESRAQQREGLSEEYETLSQEIAELRSRKDDIKRQTRDAFTGALEDLLDRFDTGFEMARLTSTFDLVVARDGRQTNVDALSEGERELLGFIAALAGHEAFDVGDRVPVLLLDSLGGFASDNLGQFVEYVVGRTEYLVLTAYPEHEDFDGHELSPADWDVVSRRSDVEAAS